MQNPTTPIPGLGDRRVAREIVDGAAHVAAGTIRRHALHEVRGLVHLVVPGQFPVIEIGRQRDEAGGGEPIRHLLDAGIEPPPFLDDQDAGARTRGGLREIARRQIAIAAELNGFSHGRKNNRDSRRVVGRRRLPGDC